MNQLKKHMYESDTAGWNSMMYHPNSIQYVFLPVTIFFGDSCTSASISMSNEKIDCRNWLAIFFHTRSLELQSNAPTGKSIFSSLFSHRFVCFLTLLTLAKSFVFYQSINQNEELECFGCVLVSPLAFNLLYRSCCVCYLFYL